MLAIYDLSQGKAGFQSHQICLSLFSRQAATGEGVLRAAVLFGRASGPSVTKGGFFRFRLGLRRRLVDIKRLRFGRRPAPCAERDNLNHPNMVVERKGQHIAGAHIGGGAALFLTVNANIAGGGQLGGQCAGFEEAGVPQPFIDPHGGGRLA